MKKIVYLGSKDIGYACLKHLYDYRNSLDIEIVGVLTNPRGEKVIGFCRDRSIKIIDGLDEFINIEACDIAISVQYHDILQKEHIEKAKEIIVNLHIAPLPEYRGCNQCSYAIINNDKEFGTTIHRLEEGIDSGAIMFEKRFPIQDGCWVEDLFQIACDNSLSLFQESLPQIISGDFELIPQASLLPKRKTSIHYRNEINDLKNIDLSWSKEKIERHIRATYMPGFEPPYTIINNRKIYFGREN
tara:strand:- start:2159 stop:2890 length:732 start_codon:yes stop_codon:yes gene_type:complete